MDQAALSVCMISCLISIHLEFDAKRLQFDLILIAVIIK